jgi:hypothetical protein
MSPETLFAATSIQFHSFSIALLVFEEGVLYATDCHSYVARSHWQECDLDDGISHKKITFEIIEKYLDLEEKPDRET